jgi:hypothetical protein
LTTLYLPGAKTLIDHLLLQLLGRFFVLFAKGLQLGDPSAGFFSMVAKLTDLLDGFAEIPVQGTGQLHLIQQISHVRGHDLQQATPTTSTPLRA